MADFCKQCSIANFGHDYRDLAGLTKESDVRQGKFAVVLCEGCGPIQVDVAGACISPDCLEKHGVPQ